MKVGPAAPENGDELAGASEQPKRSGVWNKYDDMAAAGIFAAARAAGATGAGIRYGEVHYKVWFNKPQGDDPDEVTDRIKALQLATADARLEELERRNASRSTRAQKEKQRKQKQKAAKKAAQALQQPEPSPPQGLSSKVKSYQQGQRGAQSWQHMQAGEMTDSERAAAETAAYITAASMKQPATSRITRTARLEGRVWQLVVPAGTKAATLNEQQLGRALVYARDEQQHAALLQEMKPPSLGTSRGNAAATKSEGSGTMEIKQDSQPDMDVELGFELHESEL